MMTIDRPLRRLLGPALLASIALVACDNPVDVDDDDDHAEPETVQVRLGSQVLASADLEGSTGELRVAVGEETDHLTVEFLDHDGDVLEPDDEEYLEVDVGDDDIAGFEQDSPGEFGGHVHGLAAGETTMRFKLMHGAVGSGHSDFTPAEIRVVVE